MIIIIMENDSETDRNVYFCNIYESFIAAKSLCITLVCLYCLNHEDINISDIDISKIYLKYIIHNISTVILLITNTVYTVLIMKI